MNSTQTAAAPAEEAASPKKEEPKQYKRPKRRRVVDYQTEAIHFISAAIEHLKTQDAVLNSFTVLGLRTMFRNYCAHTGLRGAHKEYTWNAVNRLIAEAKASAVSPEQEL